MRKKEIVILDCGVEVRCEEQGLLFSSMDTNREFAFGLKADEIPDMIRYLNEYLVSTSAKIGPAMPMQDMVGKREMTPVEKARSVGVEAMPLASPSSAGKGRVIPATAVSVHKG